MSAPYNCGINAHAWIIIVSLHYLELGEGDPLVLLHGLFGSGTNLRGLAKRLAAVRRVVLADLRNHGSSPHASDMRYQDMADDLDELLAGVGAENADFVGHSMGGKAAMVLALTRPHRVRSLAVVDIAPVSYGHGYLPLIQAMRGLDLSRLRSRGDADRTLAAAVPDDATRMFVLQNLINAGGTFSWRINLDAIERYMEKIIGFPQLSGRRFDGPCVFLAGQQSDYVRDQHRAHILELFPRAELNWIPGAGHWVHVDQPQALAGTLLEFLEDVRD